MGGTAGASARREHERRQAKRENSIRAAHPRLGGVILALTDDPQSTRAWKRGAVGEEKLGRQLDGLASATCAVLHDRRIPRSRANIDHLVVCPTGILVIDAKRYQGRPSRRVEGGLFCARTERLFVGRQDRTTLVDGVLKQADVVRGRLSADLELADLAEVPVRGALGFVDADWPLIGGAFTVRGVMVAWPKKLADAITAPGPLGPEAVARLVESLSRQLPPA